MKKNVIRLFLVLSVFAAVCIAFTSCGDNKTEDKLEYKINEQGEAEIVGYSDLTTRTEITVPDDIEGAPVVKICDFGLCNAESLQKITIGKNVREIGAWAMTNNQGLREYAVSDDNESFTVLDGVLFTKDMKTIVSYPAAKGIEFNKYNTALNTVTYDIPDGVEVIASKAFYKCGYLTHVEIPESILRIEEKAFHKASALETVEFGSKLEYIGKDAFAYCDKLIELNIPASVKEIGECAFYSCNGVLSVNLASAEEEMTLGNKWYPTKSGKKLTNLKINWSVNV